MITKNNFEDLLKTLNFEKIGNIYQKKLGEPFLLNHPILRVDFNKKELIYPEDQGLIVNERQTCNFSQNENFVVFECVHRLLDKGYQPKHLELERPYRIGHGASGGRTDILIKDNENNPLIIIECKTSNKFEKAWDETCLDGGQLFTYVHQEAETKYLCLYASSFLNNKLDYKYKLIHHIDNPEILAEDAQLTFEKANKSEQRFTVWRDTYKLEYTETGIFERSIQPYQIGKTNYILAEDTKPIDIEDKKGKYDRFRKILRKYNIARRETAFEVLVNLFLCKLVDEEENKDNLRFFWNGPAYDNYYDFVDRLQNLYQRGMRKFLNEEISYISREQIDEAFWPVTNDKNDTKKLIHEYFTELKFFSNSAFSFLETHNKALFERNTVVLSEVVKMWQGLRLKSDTPNQFLGDMFEFFLDNGIKQSEGQFFTPLPICKFIVSSLPLAQAVDENPESIKMIDFACGSGHFLNEYAYQIKQLDENNEIQRKIDLNDYYNNIIGIEKDNRLAKVAKVSAYMHGQGEITVLDADALATHPEIQRESYNILVANPPFAVKEFLHTLGDKDKEQFQLIRDKTTKKDSDTDTIQCFFLEKIHHLMAPGGLVGVIVPLSILSKSDAIHIKSREIMLRYFDVVCIANLCKETFSKTQNKTVILFLKRKLKSQEERLEQSEHYNYRVNCFFEGDKEKEIYQDHHLIQSYCDHIDVPYDEYKKLFAQTSRKPLDHLMQYDIFKEYKEEFNQDTSIKRLKNTKGFQRKTDSEQSAELEQLLINHIHKKEKSKLYYFILAHIQANDVLIVDVPDDKTQRKQFLGYEWSGTKGYEGIKYFGGETVNDIESPLFDPNELNNETKINTAIKHNFVNKITDPLPPFCRYVKLTTLLNFNRVEFKKIIRLYPLQDIDTQWPMEKLGSEIDTIETGSRPEGGVEHIISGALSLGGEHIHSTNGTVDLGTPKYVPLAFYHGSTKGILKENDILLCKDGALTGKIALLRDELNDESAMVNEHVFLMRSTPILKQHYIFYFLFSEYGQELFKYNITGSAQGGINLTNLKHIKIPLPDEHIQQQIVDECEKEDRENVQAITEIITKYL